MKFLEKDLPPEIISRIQPLRNLETTDDLKDKMKLVVSIYSEFAQKIATEQNLTYDQNIENSVKEYISQYIENFAHTVRATGAKYAIPFASNHCHLHPEVMHFNQYVQTPRLVEHYFKMHHIFSQERLV